VKSPCPLFQRGKKKPASLLVIINYCEIPLPPFPKGEKENPPCLLFQIMALE